MHGNLFNVLRGLHEQVHGCECVKNKLPTCAECAAAFAAIHVLETVPRLREMSEGIERAFFAEAA